MSQSLAGRRLTISVEHVDGKPAPDVALTLLALNGVSMLGSSSGSGPWVFEVPSSSSADTVAWTVTATNRAGSAADSGSQTVEPDLFAPSAAGTLRDLTLVEGTAMAPVDLTADFSGTTPLSFALAPASARLPEGLALSPDGLLSGTPSETHDARSIVIRASNGHGHADSGFGLTVETSAQAPAVTVRSQRDGRRVTLSVETLSGEPAPVVALTRLTLDGTDVRDAAIGSGPWVYYVPSDPTERSLAWTVTATNAAGSDADDGFETIPPDLFAPDWTTLPSLTLSERGVTVTTGEATGAPASDYAIVAQAGGVTVTMAGSGPWTYEVPSDLAEVRFTATVTASNSIGDVAHALTVAIAPDLFSPSASGTLGDLTLVEGAAMTPVDLAADFTGTAPLSFALAPASARLPEGLGLSMEGLLSGTPREVHDARSIVVQASNAHGHADSGFSLTVTAASTDFRVLAHSPQSDAVEVATEGTMPPAPTATSPSLGTVEIAHG